MWSHRLIAFVTVSMLGSVAFAGSKYRVVGVEPTTKGARLKISFENEAAGGKAAGVDNIKASLFVYTANPSSGSFIAKAGGRDEIFKTGDMHKKGGIPVGKFDDWKGTGMAQVDLDYGKLGLKPGQQIWTGVNFFWDKWGHSWGDHKSGCGSGGPHTLPELGKAKAKKNSGLRWRAQRGRAWSRGACRLRTTRARGGFRSRLRSLRLPRHTR